MQWCQDPMPLTLPLHRRLMATSTSTSITMSTRRLLLPRARPTSTRSTRSTTMLLLPLPTPPTHLTHLTHLTPQRSHLRACTRPTRTRPPIWRVTVDSPSTKSSPQRRYCHHSHTLADSRNDRTNYCARTGLRARPRRHRERLLVAIARGRGAGPADSLQQHRAAAVSSPKHCQEL